MAIFSPNAMCICLVVRLVLTESVAIRSIAKSLNAFSKKVNVQCINDQCT